MPEQGEIVLIPIPFTDLSSEKRRPVINLSNNAYNQRTDDIVVAMTSNPDPAAYSFSITSSDLNKGALNRPSKVMADKIYSLSQSSVVKTFGKVNSATLEQIQKTIQELIANKPSPI